MPVEFTGVGNQGISFTGFQIPNISSAITITAWVNLHSLSATTNEIICQSFGEYYFALYFNQSGKVFFYAGTFPGAASWGTSVVQMSTGTPKMVAVTYDAGNVSNDPIIYVNGASVTITEIVAPSTTVSEDVHMFIGTSDAISHSIDGYLYTTNLYNRILSATEILYAYNSRLAIPTYQGLVFAPLFIGAQGLQTFDGATLGTTNYINDMMYGNMGNPSGSPVGRGDTYLRWS